MRQVMVLDDGAGHRLSLDTSESNDILLRLEGWYGGASVRRDDTARLTDGLFDTRILRGERKLTLRALVQRLSPSEMESYERTLSGLFPSGGPTGSLSLTNLNGTLTAGVQLDGPVKVDANLDYGWVEWELPLICPDPYLYGEVQSRRIVTAGAGRGLVWPLFRNKAGAQVGRLDWGAPDESDTSPLTNTGNATAYPVVRVSGNFPAGFELSLTAGDWHRIVFNADVRGREIVVDFSGSVTVDGVDMSWALSERGWAGVEPGQQATAAIRSLSAEGSGVAHVELRPTYL